MIACPKCKCPIAGTSPGHGSADYCPFCGEVLRDAKTGAPLSGDVREGEIVGWRGVRIGTEDGQTWRPEHLAAGLRPRIWSPVCSLLWTPGDTMIATCHGVPLTECRHRSEGDKAPAPGCSCGFYAARTRDHLLSLGYQTYSTPENPTQVLCEVAQWGRVVVASNGFRAENVRILRIYVPADGEAWTYAKLLDEDYGAYGVEVVLGDTLNLPSGTVPEWCAVCGCKLGHLPGNKSVREPHCAVCGHHNVPVA